jgi:hypothetical protein
MCGEEGEAVCWTVVEGNNDYFSFSANALSDLILITSRPGIGDIPVETVTNGHRIGGEEVLLRLELKVKEDKRIFKVTEVEAPRT